jgi:hypothetical protein
MFKEFFEGIIFNTAHVRYGKISLSRLAFKRMAESGLHAETVEDAFRYGEELEDGLIIRKYGNYTVGMYYALDETKVFRGDLQSRKYTIITVWKEVNR